MTRKISDFLSKLNVVPNLDHQINILVLLYSSRWYAL